MMQKASSTRDVTPLPIIQYWHSRPPPAQVHRALASFPDHNPGSQHLVFDESSADAFIAEHFSVRELAAFRSCAPPAMQADYFRYCAVLALGGIYVDADFECVGDLRSLIGDAKGFLFGNRDPTSKLMRAFLRWPNEGPGAYQTVDNGMFGLCEPGHPFASIALSVATANIERRIADGPRGVWLTAGPGVFTSMYLLDRLGSIDAFIQYSEGTILEASAYLFCETISDPGRIASALDGIVIRSRQERAGWVQPIRVQRPGFGSDVHWQRIDFSIFR